MNEMGLTTLAYVNTVIRERPRDVHKGQCGRVLVVAGSEGMAGAAALCAGAAIRSGAGLVRLAVQKELFTILQIAVPQVTCQDIDAEDFPRLLQGQDAVAIGPGMGVGEEKYLLIEKILNAFRGPVVIDADGLTNLCRFGKKTELLMGHDVILTPHPGECDRLLESLGEANIAELGRIEAAQAVARRTGAVVLLKGADTVVASAAGDTYTNTTGNPGMATGGSGDVLTGVIAAIAASGVISLDATRTGAFIHGMAGDIAADKIGQWGMTSADIRDALPGAFKTIVGK